MPVFAFKKESPMPVTIGSRLPANFGDPIAWMMDCHRRVENFLSILVKAGALHGRQLTGEERHPLGAALRYFREGAPKHTEDEEQSLFPRLRSLRSPDIKPLLVYPDGLERDHCVADRWHRELNQPGVQWLTVQTLPAAEAGRFRALTRDLAHLYQHHIAVEEQRVFPAVAAKLSADELRLMGEEMEARRGLR